MQVLKKNIIIRVELLLGYFGCMDHVFVFNCNPIFMPSHVDHSIISMILVLTSWLIHMYHTHVSTLFLHPSTLFLPSTYVRQNINCALRPRERRNSFGNINNGNNLQKFWLSTMLVIMGVTRIGRKANSHKSFSRSLFAAIADLMSIQHCSVSKCWPQPSWPFFMFYCNTPTCSLQVVLSHPCTSSSVLVTYLSWLRLSTSLGNIFSRM